MNKRVTIDDVARIAHVHKATVSRALNPLTRHQVSQSTLERVQGVAQDLGYVPNAMARGLRTRVSRTIGVIIPDLTNPFFPPIVRGIESELQTQGYTALLANTDGDDEIENAALASLLERRVDGLIVASGRHGEQSALARAHADGVHVVMVNRDAGGLPFPLVAGDDAAGVSRSVEHLVELGHRDLAHVAGPLNLSTSVARERAFVSACALHPAVRTRTVEADALSVAAGERSMDAMLAGPDPRPTAIVAGNDLIALGVLRSLRAHSIDCPRDMSVVGFNDITFAEDFSPPLTTVRVPTNDMGTAAARLLLSAIRGDSDATGTVVLPVSLIVRASTGPAPRA